MSATRVRVKDVIALCDVILNPPWLLNTGASGFKTIVLHCIENNILEENPAETVEQELRRQSPSAKADPDALTWAHAARIAYLVLNPDSTPIHIDVGVPGVTCPHTWQISDGNHRTYAAALRGDEFIEASLQGAVSILEEHFGPGVCDQVS